MTLFTVSANMLGTTLVVRACGELDYRNAPVFRSELTRAWEATTPPTVVIDLAGLTFCDSTGMAELILGLQRSRALGTRLVLAGVHGTLERILAITGLRSAFEVFDSAEEAVQGA
ncbi:anti-anti-sigma factor [Streptosporangium becharense]|uniref:Anti-sigma factor antagonist n=1 Tax=Streptosporangium becharense TaxID=1816182 RepID=A0A7W9IBL4_9ACTN|nr:STAS domain-containing protein [Streptosporangium becharense]MBB2913661.1 anti-anti-sigma factor [Streptosporangium becharense]MBB5817742.1 anti-anti-sigma factor [Streptosporangium becharense]